MVLDRSLPDRYGRLLPVNRNFGEPALALQKGAGNDRALCSTALRSSNRIVEQTIKNACLVTWNRKARPGPPFADSPIR